MEKKKKQKKQKISPIIFQSTKSHNIDNMLTRLWNEAACTCIESCYCIRKQGKLKETSILCLNANH